MKARELAIFIALLPLLVPRAAAQAAETEKEKQEEVKSRSKLTKTHLANGTQGMQDAPAIRRQLQIAVSDQKPSLLTKMKPDCEMAITEYHQALQDTEVRDENGVVVVGCLES